MEGIQVACFANRRGLAAAVCALLFLGSTLGCAWQRQRINIEDPYTRIARVKPGQTTTEELTAILGSEPTNIINIPPDHRGFVYGFGDSKSFLAGLIIFSVQKTNIGLDTAVFVVDSSSVVQEVIHSSNSRDLAWQFWPFGGEE
ncbi:MAG: hypothetical protein ABFS46_17165 [Myxococcota bacterium]